MLNFIHHKKKKEHLALWEQQRGDGRAGIIMR